MCVCVYTQVGEGREDSGLTLGPTRQGGAVASEECGCEAQSINQKSSQSDRFPV